MKAPGSRGTTKDVRRWLAAVLLVVVALSGPGRARAQADDATADEDVNDAVARALFEQGLKLFHQGRWSDARQLFAESIARSPQGSYSRSARQMLARCNERLGIVPPSGSDAATPPGEPVDPYASPTPDAAAPVDPYATTPEVDAPVDPYEGGEGELANPYGDDASTLPVGAPDTSADDRREARRSLAGFGATYGMYTALGLATGLGDGDLGAGGLLLIVSGGVAGGAAGYWIGDSTHPSKAQLAAVMSSTTWGASLGLMFAHIADAPESPDCVCPDDTRAGDYLLTSAVMSTVGLGAGAWLATRNPSRDDVALVNSFGGYGLVGAFMLGVAMDPAEARGYSLNAVFGSGAGLATGLWLADRDDVPAQRIAYVDLGVGAGALAPWLFYGLAGGGSSGERQVTGVASLGLGALGGWLAWRWTHGVGAPRATATAAADDLAAAPPALLSRSSRGAWSLAPVAPRPFVLAPAAADPRARVGLGIDVVSGTF